MTFHLQFDLTNRLNTSNLILKIIEVIWPESPDYFPLNTFSDQITICQISFEIFDVKQIDTQAKK